MARPQWLTKLEPRLQAGREAAADYRQLAEPVVGRFVAAWRAVSPLGRAIAAIGLVSWIAGWQLGWSELMVVAGGCLMLLVLAVLFILGRSEVVVDIRMEPPRVVAGDSSAGQVTVRNTSTRRSLPSRVELPVGHGSAVFNIDSLGPGESAEEIFVVPTERRGVINVGPARSVRGDPLGIFNREAATSERYELIVHPHTIPLMPFGSGLLRDLEGLTTEDLSPSDLAFHALREYAPGDDRRHVHWRSSARTGRLQVRQFQDTRRSTLCAVVDGQPAGYADPAEFELAIEVAASIALRACKDGLPAVVAAGDQAGRGVIPHALLDPMARVVLSKSSPDPATLVSRAVARGADISVALLISGSQRSESELQRAAARFPIDVGVLAMRVAPAAAPGVLGRGRATLLQLSELADLPGLLRLEMVR